jgi:hypothetical protein
MPLRNPLIRYGIAEWYGRSLTTLSPTERQEFGLHTQRSFENLNDNPYCPFLSELIPSAVCNKAGGVCSFRRYRQDRAGAVVVADDVVVTLCPSRFLQPLADGQRLFGAIAQQMLGCASPIVVKETPFLRKVQDELSGEGDEDSVRKAGRIDWLLINPSSLNQPELQWCAVETQSLYFSGKAMSHDFAAYAEGAEQVIFPRGVRRPDYRSSGPKRLLPQLAVKVPVLRNWGKKMVVVIDRYFADNMNGLGDAFPRAKDDTERRDNAEVVWFIVAYDARMRLTLNRVVFSTLDDSRRALNATEPFSKADFTRELRAAIADPGRGYKVFTV